MRTLLVDRSDLGTGTSGRYHGLLHSGARYVARDRDAARECIVENRVVRRIAPFAVEDTGGYFVATPDDPDDYVDEFPPCARRATSTARRSTSRMSSAGSRPQPEIRRAFAVPDAAVEPWSLIEGNVADAALGSAAVPYHKVVGFDRSGERLLAARVVDVRSGTEYRVMAGQMVSAAGAWGGQVAAMAGAKLTMAPGKGTMLVFNQRMTDASSTAATSLPTATSWSRSGPSPSSAPPTSTSPTRTIGRSAGPRWTSSSTRARSCSRAPPDAPAARLRWRPAALRSERDRHRIARGHARHVVLDHAARDGIGNLTSIVGGKLTTYRLMAQDTADVVARKAGVTARGTTAQEPVPDPHGDGTPRYHWLGGRFAAHEARGGGDADLLCECELVTRSMLTEVLDRRWPCSLDDVRRATRLGMGPCQGGCTFRAAGAVADHARASRATRSRSATPPRRRWPASSASASAARNRSRTAASSRRR